MAEPGNFTTNQATRDYFGEPFLKFVEQNMLTRPDVPLSSQADCATAEARSSLTTVFGLAANSDLKDVFCKALKAEAHTGPLNIRMGVEENGKTVNAIVFPSSADLTFNALSGIGNAFKPNVSAKDTDAFLLMHEVHHENVYAKNPTMDSIQESDGVEETESDIAARNGYLKALKEGVVTDPGVPDAVRGARALMAMTTPSKYDVASIIGIQGISTDMPKDHEAAANGIDGARFKILHEIGKDLISENDINNAKYKALADTMYAAPEGVIDKDTLDKFKNEPLDLEEFNTHIKKTMASVVVPDSLKQTHADNEAKEIQSAQRSAGISAASIQPDLAYQTARRMDAKGAFDDNKYGKAFVQEYVRAAETYAPEHFKTDGQKTHPQQMTIEPHAVMPRPAAANNAQYQMSA